MTAAGLLLIPLGVVLSLLPWPVMLMALPTFALLHGAAVVNVGSVGLQPGYFLALLVIGRSLFEIALLRQPLDREALRIVLPLGMLLTCGILVLWIAIVCFAGEVVVLGGTDGYDLGRARGFEFRRENITQLSYLAINTALVYTIAHQAARLTPNQVVKVVERGFRLALTFALALCAWQLLAHGAGLWFPGDLLFSNAGYYRADGQGFFGQLRLNGPFTEPSALAYFFAGFLFYTWKQAWLRPTVAAVALLLGVIACIGLSFSTTGYFVLAAGAALIACDLLARRLRRRAPRLTMRAGAIALLIGGAVGAAGAWAAARQDVLGAILDVSLLAKADTSSFAVRSGAELLALQAVAETGGLGIGLGSHKANSLTMTLLSNVGIAGTALFGGFVVMLLRPVTKPADPRATLSMTPLRWFILGLLLIHLLSNPNFNVVMLWVAFGLMAGYRVSVATLATARTQAVMRAPPRRLRPSLPGPAASPLALPRRSGADGEL
jgi:hypothetical protein